MKILENILEWTNNLLSNAKGKKQHTQKNDYKQATHSTAPQPLKDELPQIIFRTSSSDAKKIVHVSAFSYGNAGDILLPIVLRDLWHSILPDIHWITQPVYPVVDESILSTINVSQGVVIGGGGLFLKDTNPNTVSGWQWPCSVEMLDKIRVPVVLFAVGYNRFRGQDDFAQVFAENIRAFAEKSVYIGLRNHGSLNSLKTYIPENLHHKLVFQPCMTTFLNQLYPDVADYKAKEDFFVLNSAFDRAHLRFGQNIGQILGDIAFVCKEISKHLPLKFYSHMQSDQAILPFLQAYGIKYELVDLQAVHPRQIVIEYARPKLVLGMRGHAQMIPFGCNTPILSIISHNKMQWFLDDIEQPLWGADVLSDDFRQELLARAISILDNFESTMEFISKKNKHLYNISLYNTKIALDPMLH
jgi:polysaccharide pyruvyl transferase WcaK-like protein